MAKIANIDEGALAAWLAGKPQVILDMARQCPPGRLYRMKSTGQRVYLREYVEDRTVVVAVTGEYNFVSHERSVFGVSVDDLEECDLPGPDEPLGLLLSQEVVDAACAEGATKEERMAKVAEAAERRRREIFGADGGATTINTAEDPVLEIVRGIWKDLTGRGGLGLDNVDDETKAEIVTAWYGIVNRHFGQSTTLAPRDILREVERR